MDTGDEFFHVQITRPDGERKTIRLSADQAEQLLRRHAHGTMTDRDTALENYMRAVALALHAMDGIVEELTTGVSPFLRGAIRDCVGLEPTQVENLLREVDGIVSDVERGLDCTAAASMGLGGPSLAKQADSLRYTPTHKRALRNVAGRLDLLASQLRSIKSQPGRRLCRSDLSLATHEIEALGREMHSALGDTPGDPECPF